MSPPAAPDVTELLLAWNRGSEEAFERLVPLVYDELRCQARLALRREGRAWSLQTTALVHEVYLRLIDAGRVGWQGRAHFHAIAARLMRRVLVDLARARNARKRGGEAQRVTFDEALGLATATDAELMALDEALEALGRLDERKARVVELRYFGGLTVEETAEALGVSPETVHRDWKFSKVWLLRELGEGRIDGA